MGGDYVNLLEKSTRGKGRKVLMAGRKESHLGNHDAGNAHHGDCRGKGEKKKKPHVGDRGVKGIQRNH